MRRALTHGDLQSFLAKSQSHAQTHHNAIASCTACVIWTVKKKGSASPSINCPRTLACRKDGQTMAGMASGRTQPKCDLEYRLLAAKIALLNLRRGQSHGSSEIVQESKGHQPLSPELARTLCRWGYPLALDPVIRNPEISSNTAIPLTSLFLTIH